MTCRVTGRMSTEKAMSRQPPSDNETNHRPRATDTPSAREGTRGALSVREAGRKGGQRVRELVQRGRLAEQQQRDGEQRP
jgi:hypothetical protein